MSSKLHWSLHRKPIPIITLDSNKKTEGRIYKPAKLTLIHLLLRYDPHDFTIEPFGVVLCCPKWGNISKAAVNSRIPSREINYSCSIEFSSWCNHSCRVMPGVIRAPSHSINSVNDFAKISYLYLKGERREFKKQLAFVLAQRIQFAHEYLRAKPWW